MQVCGEAGVELAKGKIAMKRTRDNISPNIPETPEEPRYHTPGPWAWGDEFWLYPAFPDGTPNTDAESILEAEYVDREGLHEVQVLAYWPDAFIIEAAPDMFDTLGDVVAEIKCYCTPELKGTCPVCRAKNILSNITAKIQKKREGSLT